MTMVKFGTRMRTWEPLPQTKFYQNRLWGIPLLGKFIPKLTNFGDLGGCKRTFLKVTMVKFGTRVQVWESLPTPNFVEIA